jgi:DnaJ-class molecular chaperone
MASLAGDYLRRRISEISAQLNYSNTKCLYPIRGTLWFSSGTESSRTEFLGENAYDLLGVSETSSFAEIKASFRKLAKETHPDLAESKNDSAASQRFVQILAAYEVLCSQL